ncbi:MAG TPA: NAD(P)H-binding protein [Burkholderiales bacterium]|nr:NAD(P)H-binding protein [Burkholderiales bacterium]
MSPGTVLLLGATGFIGRHALRALAHEGYGVVCGVRGEAPEGCRAMRVDFARDHDEAIWLPRLAGIDYVINAVGLMRETGGATFEALHVAAPQALFRASARAGVKKVVQVSALGADARASSAYHLTKRRADEALATLPMPWVIVQPSLVFGEEGASTALFAMLASLPLVPVPGGGAQTIQPVHVDDLAEAIVRVLATSEFDRTRIAVVGPRPLTLREYLAILRRSMGLGAPHFVGVPMPLVRKAAAIGGKLPGSLLDRESLAMLERGNAAPADDVTRLLGRAPCAAERFVSARAARALANQARLAWLLPLLRYAVALVWIVTGIVSLGVYPVNESYALLERVGLTGPAASIALYGAALLDLAFGIGSLVMRRRAGLWRAQIALIVGYTILITIFLPEYWLHPYGPLTKNAPMVVAILVLLQFERSDG